MCVLLGGCVFVHNSFSLYVCVSNLCIQVAVCTWGEDVIGLREIMCASACLNQSECVSREGSWLRILYVCVHTYSTSLAHSAEACVIKHLYGEDTVFGFVCAGVCVCLSQSHVREFACKSVVYRVWRGYYMFVLTCVYVNEFVSWRVEVSVLRQY